MTWMVLVVGSGRKEYTHTQTPLEMNLLTCWDDTLALCYPV